MVGRQTGWCGSRFDRYQFMSLSNSPPTDVDIEFAESRRHVPETSEHPQVGRKSIFIKAVIYTTGVDQGEPLFAMEKLAVSCLE